MELHQLRYFVAVARSGNFSRAAEVCHVSQPSLSQQVQKLERGTGQRLFDRLGRKAVLTDAGRMLFERATNILAECALAEREIKDFDRQQAGRLAVGAIPTVAPYMLPDALQKFTREFPGVELEIQEGLTDHVVAATVAGELDLALVALPVVDDRLANEVLVTEPLLLAVPHKHRLARKPRVTLDDVRSERFILLDDMHCLGAQILSLCRQEGCQRIACRSSQLSTVQTLIALGQGVSLLPGMAQAADRSRKVVYRDLADDQPTRTVGVIWHRARPHGPATERFLRILRGLG